MRGRLQVPTDLQGSVSFGPVASRSSDDVVPPAIEGALANLERALCRDRSHVVVAASPGRRKTLLLRALTERLASSFCVVHVFGPEVKEDEIGGRILGGLGQEPGPDADARVCDLVHELARRGSALVLLIGSAGSMPAATLKRLGHLAAGSRSGLRLAMFVDAVRSGGDDIAAVVAALGVGAEKIVFDAPSEPAEATVIPRAPQIRRGPVAAEGRGRLRQRADRKPRHSTLVLGSVLALLAASLTVLRLISTAPSEIVSEPERVAAQGRSMGSRALSVIPIALPQPTAAIAVTGIPSDPGSGTGRQAVVEKEAAPSVGIRSAAPGPTLRFVQVQLNAQPWARIDVDGRVVGITPLANLPLAPGPHRFRAHFPDGRTLERVVDVDAYHDHITFP